MDYSAVLGQLASRNNKSWDGIFRAISTTEETINSIKQQLGKIPVSSSDTSLVVFGSIARNECTSKSDADWTLLVDGQARADHKESADLIQNALQSTGLAEPGKTGMFGQITFSHDLIHNIGGQRDTNHNLSKRILLLLESDNIGARNKSEVEGTAYDRVLRGIINQYIENDSGFLGTSGKDRVPRFLLNDLVRFWRTMCVDFAFKQIEQQGVSWALRNIKLRMSRKLIFVKGLLMCFKSFETELDKEDLKQSLRESVSQKPLNFLVGVLSENGTPEHLIVELMDAYDEYISMLDDDSFRNHLKEIPMESSYNDEQFEKARTNSHVFQAALHKIFFEHESKLKQFTFKYGLF